MRPGFFPPSIRRAVSVLIAVALISACGGGGGGFGIVSGVGSGGTGAYTSGPLIGFGSIFVNGVEFDDTSAELQDEDGQVIVRGTDSLRLGMMVGVDSPGINSGDSGQQATATRIRISSDIVGMVSSVDVANGRITVLGQTVQIGLKTALDPRLAGGVSSMLGQVVRIYGLPSSAGGVYVATRVEPSTSLVYKLRGVASAVDRIAKTVTVGGAVLVDSGGLPASISVGSVVRAALLREPDGNARWVVSAWGGDPLASKDGCDTKLEGIVTQFTDPQRFSVDGVPVDATALQANSAVVLGARLEAQGRFSGGTLRASELQIKTDDQNSSLEFDVRGAISSVNGDTKVMSVKGQTINFASASFPDGSVSDLAVGVVVRIKAVLSEDRTTLVATEVRIKKN